MNKIQFGRSTHWGIDRTEAICHCMVQLPSADATGIGHSASRLLPTQAKLVERKFCTKRSQARRICHKFHTKCSQAQHVLSPITPRGSHVTHATMFAFGKISHAPHHYCIAKAANTTGATVQAFISTTPLVSFVGGGAGAGVGKIALQHSALSCCPHGFSLQ